MTPAFQPGEVSRVHDQIRRVLAPNPSPMTYWGTNSYIVGQGEVALIDPGPADPAHIRALLDALDPGERITRIILTHSHLDHSAGVPALVAATGAPTYAFGDSLSGRRADVAALANLGGAEGHDTAFTPDHQLQDGEIIEGDGWRLQAIWTPGHMGNHMCFAMEDTLISGDHVMGWATSMVSPPDGDLSDFMDSLRKLQGRGFSHLLPAHGDPVDRAEDRITELYTHRKSREGQILQTLQDAPGSARDLALRIYTDTPRALIPAATRNVLAHLIDLHRQGRIQPPEVLAENTVFHPL